MGLHKLRRTVQKKIMFDETTVTNRLLDAVQSRDSEELSRQLQGWPKTPWTLPARRRCVERVWIAAAQTSDHDCLQTLLDAGINCVDLRDDLGWTALMYAQSHGKSDSVLLLLKAGASPNVSDHQGLCSPLHVAVRDRRRGDAKALLAHGADPLFNPSSTYESPLSTAASIGDETVLFQLVSDMGSDWTTDDQSQDKIEFALRSAVEAYNAACVKILLRVGASLPKIVKEECLVYSVYYGALDVMDCLLKAGARMEPMYMEDPGPVFTAVWGNEMTTGQTLECLRRLLNYGGYVDERSPTLLTPLMAVVGKGNFILARFLLQQGANVKYRDPDGQTALHHAARSGQSDVIQLLLDWGANPDIPDNFQRTPLHKMIKMVPYQRETEVIRCVCVLIQAGCDVEAMAQPFEMARNTSVLMSPLTLAIWEGRAEVAQLLMRIGCSLCPSGDLSRALEQRLFDMDAETYKMYFRRKSHPLSLKLLCRKTIRRNFSFTKMRHLDTLPLPAQLREFLRYAELNSE